MKYRDFKVYLICNVCGLATEDFVTLNTRFYDEATGIKYEDGKHWASDFADHRHALCELQHGSFKEMVQEYHKNVKPDWVEAENFVKANRKREDFDVAIVSKIQEVEMAKNGGITPVDN